MKLGLAFLFPVLAAAFAPSVQQNRDFTCLSMADAPVGGIPRGVGLSLTGGPPVSKASLVDSQGAIKPFGFWDPIGLTNGISEAKMETYRAGEIKNGRVAMLAVVGYVAQDFFRLPGEIAGVAFKDIPNGIAAMSAIPGQFWVITFFLIGASDYLNSDAYGYIETMKVEGMEGEELETRRNNEISNGRLAMLAFWELVRQDLTMGPGHQILGLHGSVDLF